VGVHHCTVSQSFIKIKVQKGTGKKLSDKEEQQIIRLLIDKNPQQLKLKFALWTRESIRQLIYQELDKNNMPKTKDELRQNTLNYMNELVKNLKKEKLLVFLDMRV